MREAPAFALQAVLDEQCDRQERERVSVSDLDRYTGPAPDFIVCDRVIAADTYALDLTSRTWNQSE